MFSFIGIFFTDLLFNLIIPGIGLGVLSLILSIFIPSTFAQYKIPLQVFGIVVFVFFMFTAGRLSEHKKYEAEAAALRLEIAVQTGLANAISTDVLVKYVDKIKIVEKIKEVPTYVYITKEADKNCRIDPATADGIRLLLDNAAKGQVPGTSSNTNATTK